MPKIFGLNLIAVLVASVLFYLVGYIWYEFLFKEAWMAASGVTAADAEGDDPIYMAGGFLITVMQVIGIGMVLGWKGAADLVGAIKTALILWLLFALPFTMYPYLYTPDHNSTMLMIDASHLLVGWVVSAAVLRLIK